MPARHHAAATSVAAPRRLPSTRSSPRTSRAGSSGVTRRSVPCRATSRRNSAGISSAASSASHFGRVLCTGCGQGFVIAFSCKGRGVCPSCNGRHMAQTAAHLVDHVIPPVPVRQWLISVPKRLRGFLADRPAAVTALTRIFIEEIELLLGAAAGVTSDASAPAAACPRLGAVSFLHRFGSRRAQLFSELGAPAAVLRPATLCARATRCDT